MSLIISPAGDNRIVTRRKALIFAGSAGASLATPAAFTALASISTAASASAIRVSADTTDVYIVSHSATSRHRWRRLQEVYMHPDGQRRTWETRYCDRESKTPNGVWLPTTRLGKVRKAYSDTRSSWRCQVFSPDDEGATLVADWAWDDMANEGPNCRRLAAAGDGTDTTWMNGYIPSNAFPVYKEVIQPVSDSAVASFAYLSYMLNGSTFYRFFRRDGQALGHHGWRVSGALAYVSHKSTIDAITNAFRDYHSARATMRGAGFAAAGLAGASVLYATIVDTTTDLDWVAGTGSVAVSGALIAVVGYGVAAYATLNQMVIAHWEARRAMGAHMFYAHDLASTCDNV